MCIRSGLPLCTKWGRSFSNVRMLRCWISRIFETGTLNIFPCYTLLYHFFLLKVDLFLQSVEGELKPQILPPRGKILLFRVVFHLEFFPLITLVSFLKKHSSYILSLKHGSGFPLRTILHHCQATLDRTPPIPISRALTGLHQSPPWPLDYFGVQKLSQSEGRGGGWHPLRTDLKHKSLGHGDII
jgi:hypothetical protein